MKSFTLALSSIATLGVLLALPAPDAQACSAPVCWQTTRFLPSSGTIPKNAPGLAAMLGRGQAVDGGSGEAVIALGEAAPGGSVDVPFTVTTDATSYVSSLVPGRALVQGAEYTLKSTQNCPGDTGTVTASFTAGPEAPLPATLGTLAVVKSEVASIAVASDGPCSETIRVALAEVVVELDASAKPWSDLLFYTTEVDGNRWGAAAHEAHRAKLGASWKGRGKDTIYAACDAPSPGARAGLPQGKHKVVIKASLIGTTVALASNEVEIDLKCLTSGGADAAPDGAVAPDGSVRPDAGGQGDDMGKIAGDDVRGSSCSAAPAAGGGDGILPVGMGLGLVAAAVAVVRGRRRGAPKA